MPVCGKTGYVLSGEYAGCGKSMEINMRKLGLTLAVAASLCMTACGASIPELTEERRKELAKEVKKKGEDAKVAIRNIRRDANDFVKKEAKANTISEDEQKQSEDEIQKLTDRYVAKIEKAIETKSNEVMTV